MSSFMSPVKIEVEKFDGKMHFGLWQVQVKEGLIQYGLHKASKGRPGDGSSEMLSGDSCLMESSGGSSRGSKKFSMSDEDWEGTKISDHLSVLNDIVSELKVIEVKIDDEDKALRLILPLSSSYEHMKPILMYGKKTLDFSKATSKIRSEERRLESEGCTSQEDSVVVAGNWKKKIFVQKKGCWECGQFGHMKQDYPNRAGSSKGSGSDADIVSLARGDVPGFH